MLNETAHYLQLSDNLLPMPTARSHSKTEADSATPHHRVVVLVAFGIVSSETALLCSYVVAFMAYALADTVSHTIITAGMHGPLR